MLVRFLSFAASVIGTRRYRPVLLSLAAVVLSVASITAVTSVFGSQTQHAASTSQQPSDAADQKAAPGLSGLSKQTPHDEPAQTAPSQTQTPSPTGDSAKAATGGNGSNQGAQATPELQLSANSLSLSSAAPSLLLHANTSDKSNVAWAVASDSPDVGVTVAIEPSTTGANVSLRFKLEQNATPGTYQFTISAKDTARGLELSKKITVMVSN